jgi:hypothetical protein
MLNTEMIAFFMSTRINMRKSVRKPPLLVLYDIGFY